MTKKTVRRRKKPPARRADYDDHCPECRGNIGYEALSQHVEGKRIRTDKPMFIEIDCPHCDCSLKLECIVEFGLSYLGT